MPTYRITDPEGLKLEFTGDAPPDSKEVLSVFEQVRSKQQTTTGTAPAPAAIPESVVPPTAQVPFSPASRNLNAMFGTQAPQPVAAPARVPMGLRTIPAPTVPEGTEQFKPWKTIIGPLYHGPEEMPSGPNLLAVAKEIFPNAPYDLETNPAFKVPARLISSGGKLASGFAGWALSPVGMAQQAAMLNPITGIPMGIKFFHDMASGGGQELGTAWELLKKPNKTEEDWQQISDHAVNGVSSILMAFGVGKFGERQVRQLDQAIVTRNTGQIEKHLAALQGQVPGTKFGEMDPDLPGANPVEQFVGKMVDTHRGETPVEYVEKGSLGEGKHAQYDPETGNVRVDLAGLSDFLNKKARTPKQLQEIVQAVVAQEVNHSRVHPVDAATFWKQMSPLEQKATLERYLGHYTEADLAKMTDAQKGWEALDAIQNELAGTKTVEAASTRGLEWLEVKTLDAIARNVHKIRQKLPRTASRVQNDILSQIADNVQAVKGAKLGEDPFSLQRRVPGDPQREARLGEVLPPVSESIKESVEGGEPLSTARQSPEITQKLRDAAVIWNKAEKRLRRAQRQDPNDLADAQKTRDDAAIDFQGIAQGHNISPEAYQKLVSYSTSTETEMPTPPTGDAAGKAGPPSRARLTERDIDKMPVAELGKLRLQHPDGIRYGITLSEQDVPRLTEKLNAASGKLQDAFAKDDKEAQLAAFNEHTFYSGALMGATRGTAAHTGTNYEQYLRMAKEGKEPLPAEMEAAPASLSRKERELLKAIMSAKPDDPKLWFEAQQSMEKDPKLASAFDNLVNVIMRDFPDGIDRKEAFYTAIEYLKQYHADRAMHEGLPQDLKDALMEWMDANIFEGINTDTLADSNKRLNKEIDELNKEEARLRAMGNHKDADEVAGFAESLKQTIAEKTALAQPGEGEPRIGPGVGPASRRRQEPYDPQQAKMFPSTMTAKGIPGAEDVPPTERVSPTEAGALPRITPLDLERQAKAIIESPVTRDKHPSFDEFTTWARRNLEGVRPEQLTSMWEDAVWRELMSASPERLSAWRESLGLEKRFGGRQLISPAPEGFALQPEFHEGKRAEARVLKAERKITVAQQRYRSRIISEIAQVLLRETMPNSETLNRRTIELDDIAFDNPNAKHDPWREISKTESVSMEFLAGKQVTHPGGETTIGLLRDEARASSRDPVSATKNLLVLLNKHTGNVEIVSAYPHGRSGIMATLPGVPGIVKRPNVPLKRLLVNHQPIYRILLKEPVQNFHQHFKDIAEFNERLGTEGQQMGRAAQYSEFAGEQPSGERRQLPFTGREGEGEAPLGMRPEDIEAEIEGTPGLRGEGGSVTGPEADIGRAEMGLEGRRGAVRATSPMTATEAAAVMDTIEGDVGKLESLADMREGLNELAYRNENKKLSGRDWSAIAALHKATRTLRRENPELTSDEIADKVLDTFYENYTKAGTHEEYIQKTLGQFGRPIGPVAGGGTAARPVERGVSRELTLLKERETPIPTERFTPAERPPAESPYLTAEAQAALAKRPVEESIPGYTLAKTPEGLMVWVRRKGGEGPASIARKSREELVARATEEMSNITRSLGNFYGRATNKREMDMRLNQANHFPATMGDEVANFIRIGLHDKPEVLEAAIAMRSAGAISARRLLSDEAQTAFEEMVTKDSKWDIGNKMWSNQKNNKKVRATGRSMMDEVENRTVKELVEAGLVDHEGAAYTFDPTKQSNLDVFSLMLDKAERAARQEMASTVPQTRVHGRKWLKVVNKPRPGLEYAKSHWNDIELQKATLKFASELDAQFDRESKAGIAGRYDDNHVPGRYLDISAPIFNRRVLGEQFRAPKTFANYYEAAAAGPYMPLSLDAAAVAGHRVRQGMRQVYREIWTDQLKAMTDKNVQVPKNLGKPVGPGNPLISAHVVVEPKWDTTGAKPEYRAPNKNYELVWDVRKGNRPLAVLRGYEKYVETLTAPSWVHKIKSLKAALLATQVTKHTLLIMDVFHLDRVFEYGVSLMGLKTGWRPGRDLLRYRIKDLPEAYRMGEISKASYDWAMEKTPIDVEGKTVEMTNAEIGRFIRKHSGLGVGRIVDAIYKDMMWHIPVVGKPIGKYNRFLFDDFQRGLMYHAAIENFKKIAAAHPEYSETRIARDVGFDISAFYGQLAKEGFWKSDAMVDLLRMPLLAPMWVGGLLRKESTFYTRTVRAVPRLAGDVAEKLSMEKTAEVLHRLGGREGLPPMGALGMGMARGLAAMFFLTQLINLATRRQPTWENEEDGHKLDAFIPFGKNGFWFSPLTLFNELTHDVYRYAHDKETAADVITSIGANKLHPFTRAAIVLGTGRTPFGEQISSTPGRIVEAAKQATPMPITFMGAAQTLGHAAAPKLVRGPYEGQVGRQAVASLLGLKIEPAKSPASQTGNMAAAFLTKNNLDKKTGWKFIQTDEPSYSKLRRYIYNGDLAQAQAALEELMKIHKGNADEIYEAMEKWTELPFTGNKDYEAAFYNSLSPKQKETYAEAMQERKAVMEAFVKLKPK